MNNVSAHELLNSHSHACYFCKLNDAAAVLQCGDPHENCCYIVHRIVNCELFNRKSATVNRYACTLFLFTSKL